MPQPFDRMQPIRGRLEPSLTCGDARVVGASAWSDRDDQSQERSFRNPGRQSNHCWLERQRNGEGPNCRSTASQRLAGQSIAKAGSARRLAVAEITCANIAEYTGRELGVSDWLTVDQSVINQFAECSGDRQWIHVDVERAKRESPYQGPIAHGYLSLSFVAPLSMQVGAIPSDSVAAFNSGLDKVRFLAPVKSGARVRLRVTVIRVEWKTDGSVILKTGNTLEIESCDKQALITESF